MIGVRLSVDATRVLERWRALPERARSGIAAGMRRALLLTEDRVRRETGVTWRRGAAGLLGRIASRVDPHPSGISGAIGFRRTAGFPYEFAQEFGAKAHGGAMAIPISPEARRLSDVGISARNFPRKLFRPPGSRVLVEAMRRRTVIHYVLARSIPPRLRFREIVAANAGTISRMIMEGASRR